LLVEADLFGLGWRTIFLINLPIGLLTLAAARALVPETPRRASALARPAPRLGRRLTTAGALLIALAMAAVLVTLDHFGEEMTSWWLAPSLALSGVAMGIVAPTLVDVTLAGVPSRDAGSASGVLNSALQLGARSASR
jgi:predicted MFS family arabinose efflux permease